MSFDLASATSFMAAHARVLDRRRFELLGANGATTDNRAAVLAALDANRNPDGGWAIDFTNYSPAAALEWRGYATVRAVATLQRNGR